VTSHLRLAPLAGSLGTLVLLAFVACADSATDPSEDAGVDAAIDAPRSTGRPSKRDSALEPWPAWATSFTAMLLVHGQPFDQHHPVYYALEPEEFRVDVPLRNYSGMLQNDQGTFFAAIDAWRTEVTVFDTLRGTAQTYETPENGLYQPSPSMMHVTADGDVFYHESTPRGEMRVWRNQTPFTPLGTHAIACREAQCLVRTYDPARVFTTGDGPVLAVDGATTATAWSRSSTCMIGRRERESILHCSDGIEHSVGDYDTTYLHPTRKLVVTVRALEGLRAFDFDAAPDNGEGGLQPAPGHVVFDPTGTRLYTFGPVVSVYDASGPLRLVSTFPAPGVGLLDIVFGPGGTTFVTFSPVSPRSEGPTLYVLRDDGLIFMGAATPNGGVHVDFSPAGTRAFLGFTSEGYEEPEQVLLWDVTTRSVLRHWSDYAPSDWRWLDETRAWLAYPLDTDGWRMHLLDGTTESEESIDLPSAFPHLGTHYRFVKPRRSSIQLDTRRP